MDATCRLHGESGGAMSKNRGLIDDVAPVLIMCTGPNIPPVPLSFVFLYTPLFSLSSITSLCPHESKSPMLRLCTTNTTKSANSTC